MRFHVSRNGQVYGPYTLEDLQRYIASGHVLLTDLAKSEDMPDWLPVSQVLSAQGVTAAAPPSGAGPGYDQPGYPPASYGGPPAPQQAYGQPAYGQAVGLDGPPDLNWGLVLLFDVLTCSLFQYIWNIIIAAWFRRVSPGSKALPLYIASAVLALLQAGTGQAAGLVAGRHGMHAGNPRGLGIYGLLVVAAWITRLVARFTLRAELEQHYNTVEPMGLRINPVLTFFFGGIYHQSVLNRVNQIKRGLAFGAVPR